MGVFLNVRCNHLVNNIRFYVNSMCTLRVLHDGHWITSGDSDLFPFQNNTLPVHDSHPTGVGIRSEKCMGLICALSHLRVCI